MTARSSPDRGPVTRRVATDDPIARAGVPARDRPTRTPLAEREVTHRW
ncbi:hypothetical protein GJ633_06220 [Halorubrum sp. CBA1125]|nr:hypothetical protein [Halorubrum sp. CBA1125]MUW14301.1 hypothetical protein [Halorubrum sp. CBA1125]